MYNSVVNNPCCMLTCRRSYQATVSHVSWFINHSALLLQALRFGWLRLSRIVWPNTPACTLEDYTHGMPAFFELICSFARVIERCQVKQLGSTHSLPPVNQAECKNHWMQLRNREIHKTGHRRLACMQRKCARHVANKPSRITTRYTRGNYTISLKCAEIPYFCTPCTFWTLSNPCIL